jgi:hypothetical protein
MKRRTLLGSTVSLGAITIAGCSEDADGGGQNADGGGQTADGGGGGGSDGDGSDSGGGADGSGDGDDSGGSEDAELFIAQAVSDLNAVAIRLNKVKDELDTPEDVDLDEDTLLGAIADARGSLDDASETAGDTQQAQIETLEHLATVLENQVRLVALVLELEPDVVAEETQSHVDDRNYDAALADIREANETAGTAEEYSTNAETALEGVDQDRLAAVDGVEYAKVESGVTKTARLVDAFSALTAGYEEAILGAKDLETGREESDAENYAAAETAFGNATAHFDTARDTFANATDDPPEDLESKLSVAECQTAKLRDASTTFEEAAAAGDDGDLATANDKRQEGEAIYDDVSNCSEN